MVRVVRPAARGTTSEAVRDGDIRDGGVRRGRMSRRGAGSGDEFFVDPRFKQPGMAYEWKRESTLGQEDTSHMYRLKMDGAWEPVPAESMPGLDSSGGVIRRGGQVLMMRPIEYSREARLEDAQIAQERVNTQRQSIVSQHTANSFKTGFDGRSDLDSFTIEKTATTQAELND